MGRGEGEFHPADPGADEDQMRGLGLGGKEGLPALGIVAEGFGGDGVVGKARQVGQVRADADIERGDVIAQGWAACQMDHLGGAVDVYGAIEDDPRPGKAGKADQIDHDLIPAVVAGDEAGQHARVGGGGIGVDDRQAHAGQRVHRPHPQDQRMGMAAADKDQVLHEGKGVLHHRPSRPAARVCAVARTLGRGGGNGEGAGV